MRKKGYWLSRKPNNYIHGPAIAMQKDRRYGQMVVDIPIVVGNVLDTYGMEDKDLWIQPL